MPTGFNRFGQTSQAYTACSSYPRLAECFKINSILTSSIHFLSRPKIDHGFKMTKNGCSLNVMVVSYTVGKPMERRFHKLKKTFTFSYLLPAPPKNRSWVLKWLFIKYVRAIYHWKARGMEILIRLKNFDLPVSPKSVSWA